MHWGDGEVAELHKEASHQQAQAHIPGHSAHWSDADPTAHQQTNVHAGRMGP